MGLAEKSVSSVFEQFLAEPGRSLNTRKKYRTKFKEFLGRYGHHSINDIRQTDLENWFIYLEERRGYSNGHLAMHRACHNAFWKYCSQWTETNIAADLPRYNEAPERIILARREDVEKAIKTCEQMWETLTAQRDAAIFALGAAGLRRSNVRQIRHSVIQRSLAEPALTKDGESFYIARTDGKEAMEVILPERLASIIRRYLNNRPTTEHDRLFINLNKHCPYYLAPLSNEGLIRARRQVCRRAGVPLISFQKMRRLMGTTVARKYGLEIAAQVLGHRSGIEVIRKHYYDPDKEAARLAVLDALTRRD